MKKAFTVLFITILIITSCSKSDWQGTIETINGITIVENPNEGLWDEKENFQVKMVKENQIGKLEGSDEYLFGRIADVAVNKKGDIYIADSQINEIRKYDPAGKYILTIGRERPGYFEEVYVYRVSPDEVGVRKSLYSGDSIEPLYNERIVLETSTKYRGVQFL